MSKGKFLSCSYGIDCFPTLRPKERRVNPYFFVKCVNKSQTIYISNDIFGIYIMAKKILLKNGHRT